MKTAVYAGTFDPLTLGHQDIIERASELFDRLIIAIAASPAKRPLLSLQERVDLAKEVLQAHPQIEVCGFSGLLIDLMQEQEARFIVRGVRSGADVDYELPLAQLNRQLAGVETLFLAPTPSKSFIAASYVREVASLGGDISALVSPKVAQVIHKKYNAANPIASQSNL
ncbi:pantetheine-phosphate adenylyltransferase [Marinospirillum sp. MEB164]|uniref:Phosphopantetheine adenylyltransferase n=1 Tax=Marinospirillum alkalitolerans TaxID=3123374 RepID=A0ABW8PTJ5_9GAMM